MESLLGTSLPVYIGLVVIFMGGAAFMTGQAIANTWRSRSQVFAYGMLLGLGARFLVFALFEGRLLSLTGFVVDVVVLTSIALFAYRITHVSRMVNQYPWLYERRGLWDYRERSSTS